ncbi:phage baseplate protein [Streptomyces boluensis]|uniref:Teichoic acid biosynthesis protein C n=1 Tax=Streptomyces boluensis TaxID=1775135 RepID=A0A964ULP0_9ACTN|nr:teichoic acid biosynthesis protein C [Streptomyces boluensis]NBE50390.1 teichoic acid biosynthesis protein C [Streptomyces boluensis]
MSQRQEEESAPATHSLASPSRRAVLGLGGAMLAAGFGASRALAADRSGAPAPAAPGVRFNLAASGTRLIHRRALHHATVMQSFAFDETHRHIYALQVIPSGVQLPGESRAYRQSERHYAGDLCLNRLSMSGESLGRMYLKGFSHGTAMAVDSSQSSGTSGVTLWVESDANPASGNARAIGRFPYAENTVLHSTDRRVTVYRPQPGSTANSVALDLTNRRLLLRYVLSGRRRFALYDLDTFATGRFLPQADVAQPDLNLGLPFQGMALHGDYVYQLMGSGRESTGQDNTVLLHCIDTRTGRVVQKHRTRVGYELTHREPEGLAVLHGTGSQEPRLCMGLASGPPGGRRFSVYGLPAL